MQVTTLKCIQPHNVLKIDRQSDAMKWRGTAHRLDTGRTCSVYRGRRKSTPRVGERERLGDNRFFGSSRTQCTRVCYTLNQGHWVINARLTHFSGPSRAQRNRERKRRCLHSARFEMPNAPLSVLFFLGSCVLFLLLWGSCVSVHAFAHGRALRWDRFVRQGIIWQQRPMNNNNPSQWKRYFSSCNLYLCNM